MKLPVKTPKILLLSLSITAVLAACQKPADTAAAFENQFGITYPSILDATTGTVQAAFAGKAAPGAVPTTIVLDRTGRMAARIIGQLPTRTTLAALIDTVLAETSP